MQSHETVLLREAVDALEIAEGATIIDATLGSGGHAQKIISRLGTDGTFIALDADMSAINSAAYLKAENVHLLHCNFRNVDTAIAKLGVTQADGILADLGWRIEQMHEGEKGFSFLKEEPLIMTYGNPDDYPFTAHSIVNEWSQKDIQNVLKGYGEERFSGRIARAITEARDKTPIQSSTQLAAVVKDAVPGFYRKGKIHPATKTFQALRIAVNDELAALTEFIKKSVEILKPNGRVAIITFHSIEDRIVKHTFRACEQSDRGTVITKKPIYPTPEEVVHNQRARSAKLRIFQKNESA